MISMVTYVPLYVQAILGGSPTEAGSAITPMVIGWPSASAVSGRALPRVGFRPLVRTGLAISAVAAVALAVLLRPGASLHVPQLLSALNGVGLGLANTALLIAVQTSVEWRQRRAGVRSSRRIRANPARRRTDVRARVHGSGAGVPGVALDPSRDESSALRRTPSERRGPTGFGERARAQVGQEHHSRDESMMSLASR